MWRVSTHLKRVLGSRGAGAGIDEAEARGRSGGRYVHVHARVRWPDADVPHRVRLPLDGAVDACCFGRWLEVLAEADVEEVRRARAQL